MKSKELKQKLKRYKELTLQVNELLDEMKNINDDVNAFYIEQEKEVKK